jgi:hypothetical protein
VIAGGNRSAIVRSRKYWGATATSP